MIHKNKLNLTPDAYKKLITISGELPRLQKLDKNGNPLYKSNPLFVGYVMDDNKLSRYTKKIQRIKEPVLVNHAVNLVDIYQQKGWPGVDKYVETCKVIAMRSAEVGEKKEVESVTV
jgi:hypothetical protein